MKMREGKPPGIVIHHSLTVDSVKLSNFGAIRRYHVQSKNFDDIGYHFVIELLGGEPVKRTGRSIEMMGAHTLGGHNNMIGICIVGNFDKTVPPVKILAKTVWLVVDLLLTYDLGLDDVHRHGDLDERDCPGLRFPWDQFMDLVRYEYDRELEGRTAA